MTYFLFLFLPISYLLNLGWEFCHRKLFDCNDRLESKDYFRFLMFASFIDMLILSLIFIVGGFIWKNLHWFMEMDLKKFMYAIIAPLIIAVIIEIKAVYIQKRWKYKPSMPILFGIGCTPLFQLSVTFLVSLWVMKLIMTNT